jgi:cobalamin biosynthetic protein CobC
VDLTVFRRHGGRIAAAEARFPQAPRPWLDLSTGVNPRPYPAPRPPRRALARLPEPEDIRALEAEAAAAFGAAADRVAAVPGSEAALRLLPRLLGARTVAIGRPTYGGHADAWRAAGAQVLDEGVAAEARVIVNPNNPDGRITPPAEALRLAEQVWTIVDEAFIDAEDIASLAPRAGGRLVVLRSFGKAFGLPGLRLGFVVAEPALAAQVRAAFGDWPVSAGAIAAGRAAYADAGWMQRTRRRLARDAARLDALLVAAGLQVVGGTRLFRLARTPGAEAVFLKLARSGVLCRPFDAPDLLRFGLPGGGADWTRLAAALRGVRP